MTTPVYKTFSDALLMQDIQRVKKILREPHNFLDLNRWGSDGQTPLHRCSSTGNVKLVRLLVEHGADPRKKNKEGWTALHLSVFRGHRKVTTFLLKALLEKRSKKLTSDDTALVTSTNDFNVALCEREFKD